MRVIPRMIFDSDMRQTLTLPHNTPSKLNAVSTIIYCPISSKQSAAGLGKWNLFFKWDPHSALDPYLQVTRVSPLTRKVFAWVILPVTIQWMTLIYIFPVVVFFQHCWNACPNSEIFRHFTNKSLRLVSLSYCHFLKASCVLLFFQLFC